MLENPFFSQIVEFGAACIRNNPDGRATANGFSVNHEYAIFLGKTNKAKTGRIERTNKQIDRYDQIDEKGPYEWANFRKDGATSDRVNRKRQYHPIYAKSGKIRVPEMEWNKKNEKWEQFESPKEGEVIVWLRRIVKSVQKEKVWRWGVERVKENLSEFLSKDTRDASIQIYKKERVPIDEGRLPPTWWDSKLYSSNEYGAL